MTKCDSPGVVTLRAGRVSRLWSLAADLFQSTGQIPAEGFDVLAHGRDDRFMVSGIMNRSLVDGCSYHSRLVVVADENRPARDQYRGAIGLRIELGDIDVDLGARSPASPSWQKHHMIVPQQDREVVGEGPRKEVRQRLGPAVELRELQAVRAGARNDLGPIEILRQTDRTEADGGTVKGGLSVLGGVRLQARPSASSGPG